MGSIARNVVLSGRVQGVGFRYSALAQAQRLGLSGWVRNLVDGRVQVFAEGEAAQVEALLEWLRRGPPGARVLSLEIEEAQPERHGGFEILPTARP